MLVLDTYTNKKKEFNTLHAYIDINDTLCFTSSPIYILTVGQTKIKYCKSILNSTDTLVISPIEDRNEYITRRTPYSSYKGETSRRMSNRIYTIEQYYLTNKSFKDSLLKEDLNPLSFLKKYTYGFEIETSGPALKESVVQSFGFCSLYDGSITGPEFTSKVFKSSNFKQLHDFLELMKLYSSHDSKCSFHFHIGNVPYSETHLKSIYSLFQRMQEELNLLIAPYKKTFSFLAEKNKDHCENLPVIDDLSETNIKTLFRLPTNGSNLERYITGNSKWNLLGRYYTVNFLNYICRPSPSNTLEIRSLQSSFNFDYILMWILVNTSIIEYATKKSSTVLNKNKKIFLRDVLEYTIKDDRILQITLDNVKTISNHVYNLKHIHKTMFQNTMDLDKIIDASIIPYELYEADPVSEPLPFIDYTRHTIIQHICKSFETYSGDDLFIDNKVDIVLDSHGTLSITKNHDVFNIIMTDSTRPYVLSKASLNIVNNYVEIKNPDSILLYVFKGEFCLADEDLSYYSLTYDGKTI